MMTCAWEQLLHILPPWLGTGIDRQGREELQELRLRLDQPPQIVASSGRWWLDRPVQREDLRFVINAASRYSPWAAQTMEQGYLTAPGGHRIGVCGDVVVQSGAVAGFRDPAMLCIRVARDLPGIAARADNLTGSILILGPPGSGKTTLLRDLARRAARREMVTVVDERGELFPAEGGFNCQGSLDILRGCPKAQGIVMALRTMGPSCIAVDEITACEDCQALRQAGWCGVRLMATAHAGSLTDLRTRPLYRPLAESGLFETVLILSRDKSWHTERMDL